MKSGSLTKKTFWEKTSSDLTNFSSNRLEVPREMKTPMRTFKWSLLMTIILSPSLRITITKRETI